VRINDDLFPAALGNVARQDSEPAIPGRPDSEWVTNFNEVLRHRLQYNLARPPDVFFRPEKTPHSFSAYAQGRICSRCLDASHLFVAISSPAYYCRSMMVQNGARSIYRATRSPSGGGGTGICDSYDLRKEKIIRALLA
jgi:hypothetical protein